MISWRVLWTFFWLGSAGVLAYRGLWGWMALASLDAVLPVAGWVRGELIATRDMMCRMPVAGKHRRHGRPRELRDVRAVVKAAARVPLP